MCHLVLNFGHLITVGLVHPNAMQFICFGITLFLNTWYSINSNSPLENLMRVLVHVINMQFGIHSKDSEYQPLVMAHSLAFGGRGCFFSSGRLRKCRIFNSTLGYPGEGPKKKTMTTWADLIGPMCIFLDDKWHDGELIAVRENHVLYSLDTSPPDQFILQKDLAYKLIRTRDIVKSIGKGGKYNGKNPLIFGPDGSSIYGKKIRERKDRSGFYRLEIKYKPTKTAKVKNININLGKHVSCLIYFSFFLYHTYIAYFLV